MPGLNRELVEHKLPITKGATPVKQAHRRLTPMVTELVHDEVKILFKAGYIRTVKYVEWISIIVPIIKKMEKDHDPTLWTLLFDGSRTRCETGIGIVIHSPEGNKWRFAFKLRGNYINNFAEYEAFIKGLEIMVEMRA